MLEKTFHVALDCIILRIGRNNRQDYLHLNCTIVEVQIILFVIMF